MKKIMLTAGAVAMASAAFSAPTVYDYKASVKHMYLKEVGIKVDNVSYKVYQKYQKNASLKGYLVMDSDGATSQSIVRHTCRGIVDNVPTYDYNSIPATGVDFGRNRGFLVVLNTSLTSSQEKQVKYAKILPAVLDAKWIDTAWAKKHAAQSGDASGTLYAGGDLVAAVRPNLDRIAYMQDTDGTPTWALRNGIFERGGAYTGDPAAEADGTKLTDGNYKIAIPYSILSNPNGEYFSTVGKDGKTLFAGKLPTANVISYDDTTSKWVFADPDAAKAGIAAIADYRWTSMHLFGWFNGPNWFLNAAGESAMVNFESAWDLNLPKDLRVGFADYDTSTSQFVYDADHCYFHDAWLNGAGFGRWTKNSTKTNPKRCCGRVTAAATDWSDPVLESLQGNLKGGLFLCTENGIHAESTNYMFFDSWAGGRGAWEDQFVTARIVPAIEFDVASAKSVNGNRGTFATRGDKWQNDMWQDGSLEQETTDVVSGNWSIKLNTKFFADTKAWTTYGDLTADEKRCLIMATSKGLVSGNEAATGLEDLVETLKVAVGKLSPNAVFINGREITDVPVEYQDAPAAIPEYVPVITPKFALYYGLANWYAQ